MLKRYTINWRSYMSGISYSKTLYICKMNLSIRKYLSLFLLSIFLFAYTEKSVHDVLHADDVHCHSITEKHFHNIEHHCAICDFEFPFFDKAHVQQLSFTHSFTSSIFLATEQNIALSEISSLPSRAPPVVA